MSFEDNYSSHGAWIHQTLNVLELWDNSCATGTHKLKRGAHEQIRDKSFSISLRFSLQKTAKQANRYPDRNWCS